MYIYDVLQILLPGICFSHCLFYFLILVSVGSSTYFQLGDTAAKLAKEELDLPSMMASEIAASLPPARESYRAAAIIPNTHMQLRENLNSESFPRDLAIQSCLARFTELFVKQIHKSDRVFK